MSTYKFTITGRHAGNYCFPSLNQYIAEISRSPHCGNSFKRKYKNIAIRSIRAQLRSLKIKKPVVIKYRLYEPEKGRKRDVGNVISCADKFIEDALQDCGVLQGDDPRYVKDIRHEILYTAEQPKIEVILQEVEKR